MTEPMKTAAPAAAEPQIVPLDQIGVAPENLRASEPADADIPELANTIEAAGLLYPLLLRPGRKGEAAFMALDGRRRLLALQSLAADGRMSADHGVKAEVARGKALQAAAIVVSNTQRAPVHVADVIVAIGKLKSLKMTSAKVAAALGYAEIEVKRLQRLAASSAESAFEGSKLRFFAALLSGLNAPSLIGSVRQDLAKGRCAVVQVVSTNEAVMERRLLEIPPEEWNNLTIDLTPKDTVLDYLRSAFPTDLMQEIRDEDGEVTLEPVRDAHGAAVQSQEALRLRDELLTELACLPAVPGVLDAVIEAFGTEEVAEITGRSRRVVTRDGRRAVDRSASPRSRAACARRGARLRSADLPCTRGFGLETPLALGQPS